LEIKGFIKNVNNASVLETVCEGLEIVTCDMLHADMQASN
jgi:hypothetical protein